jgi:hypothetical protein
MDPAILQLGQAAVIEAEPVPRATRVYSERGNRHANANPRKMRAIEVT